MNEFQQKLQQNREKAQSLLESFFYCKGVEMQRRKEFPSMMSRHRIFHHIDLDFVALSAAYLALLFAWLGWRVRTLPPRTPKGSKAALIHRLKEEAASHGLSLSDEEITLLMRKVFKEMGEEWDDLPE